MLFVWRIEPHDLQTSPLNLDYFVIQELFEGRKEWTLNSILFNLLYCCSDIYTWRISILKHVMITASVKQAESCGPLKE